MREETREGGREGGRKGRKERGKEEGSLALGGLFVAMFVHCVFPTTESSDRGSDC